MKIDLLDIDKFVEDNNMIPITDPVIFNRGFELNPNGLLSTVIFGNDINTRKTTFSYIDLNGHYLTPIVFKLLKRLNRKFEDLILGTQTFIIDSKGQIVEDENGDNGPEFLYNNWEKLKFNKNESRMRGERIDLLTAYKKDRLFVTKAIVIPAFYRDVNIQTLNKKQKVAPHEINDMYSKLIRTVNIIKQGVDFDFMLNNSRAIVQNTLVEIYDLLESKIAKKNGLIRKNLMGKSVDYSSRMVISAPIFNSNRPEEMKVDFYHCGVPLAQCCSLFMPFMIHWLKSYFDRELFSRTNYPVVVNDKGDVEYIDLDKPENFFTIDYLKKKLDQFIYTTEYRFEKIQVPVVGGKMVDMIFTGILYNAKNPDDKHNKFTQVVTWTDLLYRGAYEITQDKTVFVTRYPVTDHFSSFPNLITVLSTHRTIPVMVGSTYYPFYPIIDFNVKTEKIGLLFADTVVMSNLYLGGLGGDYDGDQITIKGIYSQEANKEAMKIIKSKSNLLNVQGECNRESTNESIQALYNLTKN
ncbi:MAG: hypothetical protein PHF63_00635 [Herbinix sp.]|nr:hypothetical protein [Herbinix sp.]